MRLVLCLMVGTIPAAVSAATVAAEETQRSSREIIKDLKANDLSRDTGLGGMHEMTRLEARRIASQVGIVEFDTIIRRGDHIVVDGVDGNGEALSVQINRNSGQVLNIRR